MYIKIIIDNIVLINLKNETDLNLYMSDDKTIILNSKYC